MIAYDVELNERVDVRFGKVNVPKLQARVYPSH